VDQEQPIGPVQFSMARFEGPELPAEVRRTVNDLCDQNVRGVRLVDALVLRKNTDGTMTQQAILDPGQETPNSGLISKLLNLVEAEEALGAATSVSETYEVTGGRGAIFRGGAIPDPRDTVPEGSSAVIILIEHGWATPFRNAILRAGGTPVAAAWVGFDALQELGLISSEAAAQLAGA
jgi:hypothetical protein